MVERLTVRDKKGRAYFDDDSVLIRGANGTFRQKKDMTAHYIHDRFVALDKVIERLAAYEDTGLTPEEVKALRDGTAPILQAKIEDRLVVLPCKVGDTVYVISKCDWVRRDLDGTMYGPNGELGTATGYYCAFDGCEDNCPLAAGKDECDQKGYAIFEDIVVRVGVVYDEESEVTEPFVCTEKLTYFLDNKVYLTHAEAEDVLAEIAKGGAE